jgi:hypothetical protein
MTVLTPVSLFHNNAAFAPSTSLVARFAPHVAGLRALLAAAALLMEMRAELAFLRKLSPRVKALRKDSKMTLDNSKPYLPTNHDWEIGVNIWRIFT